MRTWRICARRHARTAFAGEGARRFGGRWNRPGTPMVYTAESLSLAALEVFVNLDPEDLPDDFVAVAADVPDSLRVRHLEVRDLPRGWRSYPAPPRLQEMGTAWARAGESAVLAVPSAVVPEERIYLLNPAHPEFKRIRPRRLRPFVFDPRLLARLR